MRRWLTLCVALAACSSDDGGSGGSFGFAPAVTPAGPSVTLEQHELRADEIVLRVTAHDVADVYGAAFRLKYDPTLLAFVKLEAGSGWGGAPPIVLSKAAEPGLLVAAVSKKGSSAGVTGAELPLATVTLKLLAKKPSSLELVAGRSELVSSAGKTIAGVSWAGGQLGTK